MDHTGRRMDIMQRPELLYGTVEYAATKDYCKVRIFLDIIRLLSGYSFRREYYQILWLIYLLLMCQLLIYNLV